MSEIICFKMKGNIIMPDACCKKKKIDFVQMDSDTYYVHHDADHVYTVARKPCPDFRWDVFSRSGEKTDFKPNQYRNDIFEEISMYLKKETEPVN